jgi:hypothetical protein
VGACAHRRGDATAGSALDCDLARREDARHGGRARPGPCERGHQRGVTAGTADPPGGPAGLAAATACLPIAPVYSVRRNGARAVAVVEILRNGAFTTDGGRRVDGRDVDVAAHLLEEQLARLQAEGKLRSDFDPGVMSVAIRATIDVVPHRLVLDPDFDIENYAREIAAIFDLATRKTH